MGCKQCSHLLGQEGGNNPHSNNGDGYDSSGHDGTNEDGEYSENHKNGSRHGYGRGRHNRHYSTDNAPHGNNLTDISEESSSAC